MTAMHTPSVTADNEEAVQGFQPFGPMANDDSALLLGFDDPGPFPALELNLAIVDPAGQFGAGRVSDAALPDGPGFASATLQMGILERQRLAEVEPAQG